MLQPCYSCISAYQEFHIDTGVVLSLAVVLGLVLSEAADDVCMCLLFPFALNVGRRGRGAWQGQGGKHRSGVFLTCSDVCLAKTIENSDLFLQTQNSRQAHFAEVTCRGRSMLVVGKLSVCRNATSLYIQSSEVDTCCIDSSAFRTSVISNIISFSSSCTLDKKLLATMPQFRIYGRTRS